MKKILFLAFLFLPLILFGKDSWSVTKKGNNFFLVGSKIKLPLQCLGGSVSFIKSKDIPNNSSHKLLIYDSGSSGTKYLIYEKRAIIFNIKTKKSIGDYPWEYKSDQGYNVDKVIWSYKKNKISIQDKEQDLSYTIDLK